MMDPYGNPLRFGLAIDDSEAPDSHKIRMAIACWPSDVHAKRIDSVQYVAGYRIERRDNGQSWCLDGKGIHISACDGANLLIAFDYAGLADRNGLPA